MKKHNILFLTLVFLLMSYLPKVDAQEIPNVVISEVHTGRGVFPQNPYYEITNVGSETVNLSNYELGLTGYWTDPKGPRLPDVELAAGESFVVGIVHDLAEKNMEQELHLPGIVAPTRPEIWEHADVQVHIDEGVAGDNGGLDSINTEEEGWGNLVFNSNGQNAVYLEYHVSETDSIVIDAFRNDTLEDEDRIGYGTAKEVAGIDMESMNGWVLVRKTTVTQGSTNWDDQRGTTLENTEWLPIPVKENFDYGDGNGWFPDNYHYRPFFTFIGNHIDSELDEEYVSSDVVDIDWDNQTMKVPWGIYRDTLMEEFNIGQSIGWYLHYDDELADSFSNIVQSGDTLTMYAVGPALEEMHFEIEQDSAAEDMNLVFPYDQRNWDLVEEGGDEYYETSFSTPWYVTEDHPVIDSIGGLPYRVRIDSLFKFLEKAPKASWDILWSDGVERVDLYRGDTLRVTAEDGSVKNYYLSVDSVPEPSQNADLAAITWPDAPAFVRQNPNWDDDTIPGFQGSRFTYQLKVPYNTPKIPALMALPEDLNAQITVDRATNINGTVEDRTFTFTVAAEDDTTINTYTVIIEKEKPEELIQPLHAEPMLSQYQFRISNNSTFEVYNPGNQPLDLSNYVFFSGYWRTGTTPQEMWGANLDRYEDRHDAYIPGYKPVSEEQWASNPGYYEKDLEVNPIVQPGETFTIGFTPAAWREFPFPKYALSNMALLWLHTSWSAEQVEEFQTNREYYGLENTKVEQRDGHLFIEPWNNNRPMVIAKILNDSILNGSKGRGDISDLELIEVFGDYTGERWKPTGRETKRKGWEVIRKPQYWKPNDLPGYTGSFDSIPENSEWGYWQNDENPDRDWSGSIGIHSTDPITEYRSTITSLTYKVSDGYKRGQSIEGIVDGTTISELKGAVEKDDPGQSLEVIGKDDGDALAQGDTLKVLSADSTNYTTYGINIGPLSDDAMLTSTEYEITADDEAGTGVIAGIPFGTSIKEVRNSVTKPEFATLNIIDEDDNLVPLQKRNYDSLYVNTQATGYIAFEVIAENNEDRITYQLQLALGDSSAYATSELYEVNQDWKQISLIPQGTNVQTFFTHLKPNKGAYIKLIDKAGFERHLGPVRFDDQVIVTSADSTNETIYNLKFIEEKVGTEAWVVSGKLGVDQRAGDIWGIQQNLQVSLLEGLLTAAPQASLHFLSADSTELSADDPVERGYLLKVISGDSLVEKYYHLYFSEEKPGTGAYVISANTDSLTVTEAEMKIEGLEMGATISDLMSLVIPAPKATMEVLDASGNPVESGVLAEGYQLEVTSGDMQKQVTYEVVLTITAVDPELAEKTISVYPNPATNNIYLDGLRANSQVVVRNVFGSIVKMIDSQDIQNGQVSVSSLPSGIYFISIETEDFQSEPVRLIKE